MRAAPGERAGFFRAQHAGIAGQDFFRTQHPGIAGQDFFRALYSGIAGQDFFRGARPAGARQRLPGASELSRARVAITHRSCGLIGSDLSIQMHRLCVSQTSVKLHRLFLLILFIILPKFPLFYFCG